MRLGCVPWLRYFLTRTVFPRYQWAQTPRALSVVFCFSSSSVSLYGRLPYFASSLTWASTWATRSTMLTSANRSPTWRHTHCLPSALYSENRDSSWREHLSKVPDDIRMWAFAHSRRLRRRTAVRSRPRWGRRACRWASLRRFLTVCAEMFWLYKLIVAASCPSGWSQTIVEVKMLDVEVLGWCDYTWSAVGCTAKFSETPLETAYGREINIQFTSNSSDGHSCSQHANCTLPQKICGIVLCDKTAYFRVAFYCGQPKAHLCNNHAV